MIPRRCWQRARKTIPKLSQADSPRHLSSSAWSLLPPGPSAPTSAFRVDIRCNRFQRTQLRFLSATLRSNGVLSSTDEEVLLTPGVRHDRLATGPEAADDLWKSALSKPAISGRGDAAWHDIVHSLTEQVKRNVEMILTELDQLQQQQQNSSAEASPSTEKQEAIRKGRVKRSLRERWNAAKRRERYLRARDEGGGVNDDRQYCVGKIFLNLTVDELWEQALRSAKLDHLLLPTGNDKEGDFSVTYDDMSGSAISPIFGLAMDSDYTIISGAMPELDQFDDDTIPLSDIEMGDEMDDILSEEVLSPTTAQSDASEKAAVDGISHAIALLSILRKGDWALLSKLTEQAALDQEIRSQNLLDHAQASGRTLSTNECNLILAHFLVSRSLREEDILGKVLQLFNEMIAIQKLGLGYNDSAVGANSTSYRMVLLALVERLNATGEAARICKVAAESSSVDLSPETLVEAVRVCQMHGDLHTARKLMAKALATSGTTPLTLGSCRSFLEMLMSRNMAKEAITFFQQIHNAKLLKPDSEDEILLQLCRWPSRSRNGDAIDCTPVLRCCMDSLLERLATDQRPRLQLFLPVLERLAHAAVLDPSLETTINVTLRRVLIEYPDAWPGVKLLTIGLRTAEVTKDAELVAKLIARQVTRMRALVNDGERETNENPQEGHMHSLAIPQMIFRKALELALQRNDVQSALSILDSFVQVEDGYHLSARAELHGLALLCSAKAGESQKAKNLLLTMIASQMSPQDNLFGAVLQCLILDDRQEEAREIFSKMESTEESSFPSPSVSSFNAMLVSHVRREEWDDAIAIHERMQANNIVLDSQTLRGLILAYSGRDGIEGVRSFLKDALCFQPTVNEQAFLLAARVILPHIGGKNLDEFRKEVRSLGEATPGLRDSSLKLIVSARTAEVEEKKLPNARQRRSQRAAEGAVVGSLWVSALFDLLSFADEVGTLNASKQESPDGKSSLLP